MMKIILSVLLVISVAGNIGQKLLIMELEGDIQTAMDAAEEASTSVYQDCQSFMQIEARIQRVNGCYTTVEELCSRTDRPTLCMEKMIDVCTRIK
jgi:hypothetical protein